nr:hypothetical protein [Tanacetum cinerariifolium]
RIVLSIEDKLNYLEQLIPLASVAPAVQQVAPEILATHNAWIKGSKEITPFAQQAEQELLQTTRDFHSCRQEEGQLVSSYVLTMKGYIDNLERLGHPMGKIVNELHVMLKLHEQTLPKNNALAVNAIRAGKVQKGNKHKKSQFQMAAKEEPTKDSICQDCGKIGHWKRNCPQYLVELLKKKKNAASRAGGSGIFVIKLNTILNSSWIYDTGCSTYICNTTQGLRASRKLKPGALSLYVGNGQHESVEAIDAFYLCLPSGLETVLNNCQYAPSITRGVISVSRLYEDGFINRFMDNTIQVSRNNMVYFSSIPRDGIFRIDLSNSLTNESSIYALSSKRAKLDLDSALLWHCCLGHISKKCIEKLQNDRLLDSSDLRAFEKCVLYDFSRYGYVCWLKHKHEVFETYKVFQKEVENQLVLGCEALVKRDTLTKPDKLEPKSIKCIFIGHPKETKGYSFYYPPDKVLVARNAEFLENSLINQEASESLEDLEII